MTERHQDVSLNPHAPKGPGLAEDAFRYEGGIRATASVEFPLTVERIQQWVDTREQLLRVQQKDRSLDPESEAFKSRLDLTTSSGLWRWYKHLVGLGFVQTERYAKRTSDEKKEATLASLRLRTREPVHVDVAGRLVAVTGRSRNAMIGMARHELARRQVVHELNDIAQDFAETERKLSGRWRHRGPLRRRLRNLSRLHALAYWKLRLHTRWILAHMLTESGAPARSASEAPDWWEDVSPVDEAIITTALFEVGPLRYAKLGPEPEPDPASKKWKRAEEFGADTLFASIEGDVGLTPIASADDRDYFQMIAWRRNSAPPRPPKEN